MKPSLGRIVLFRSMDGVEYPSIITRVWSDTCVNLMVFSSESSSFTSIVQDEEMKQTQGWRWPPRIN